MLEQVLERVGARQTGGWPGCSPGRTRRALVTHNPRFESGSVTWRSGCKCQPWNGLGGHGLASSAGLVGEKRSAGGASWHRLPLAAL